MIYNNIYFKAIVFIALNVLLAACGSTPKSQGPTGKLLLPEGNLSTVTAYDIETGKAIIDSNVNTRGNDIAPTLALNKIQGLGYLEFCDESLYYEQQGNSVAPSNYLTKSDFRRNTDSLIYFSNLTNYIESVSFISEREGFIALSHPPNESVTRKTGLSIQGVEGGTDIFLFTINSEGNGFSSFEGFDVVNTPFWDSHPFGSAKIINGDTVKLVIWSSDYKSNQAYTESLDIEGQRQTLNDTDIYYSYIVNGKADGPARKLSGNVSKDGSFEGSPFVHCLCEETNWLFFSSDRGNEKLSFDIYATKIKADFENRSLDLVGEVFAFDNESKEIKDEKDSVVAEIPKSINSNSDDRFPFVLNRKNGNPQLFFSSNRLSDAIILSDSTYIKSLGNYDLYAFELDEKFRCIPEPPKEYEYFLEVAVLETNPGNAEVESAQIKVEKAELIRKGRYKLTRGECYEVQARVEETGYELGEDGKVYNYYYQPVLKVEFDKYINSSRSISHDTTYANYPYQLKNKLGTSYQDTIESIEIVAGNKLKKVIYRSVDYAEGFGLSGNKVFLASTTRDSIASFGRLIPDPEDDFVLRNEKTTLNQDLRSVYSTFEKICIPESNLTEEITIYDTIWVSRRISEVPDSRLVVTLIDKCETDKPILKPVIEVSDSNGEKYLVEDNRIVVELKPDMIYNVMGGSLMEGADCDTYIDMIHHGYQRYNDDCGEYSNNYISGAEVSSLKGSINTSGMLRDTVIYDTIYIKSHYSVKPPCEIAFTTLKGINKNVPYFQTAFWEVNTSENLGSYEEEGTHLYYLGGEGYDSGHPYAERSKFIELHPKGQYFPFWKGEETQARQKRIAEYKEYAKQVDKNLNHITRTIAEERIPQFMRLQNISPESQHKLVIELQAISDRRPVREGVYTGNETIEYTEAQYIPQSGNVVTEIVVLSPGSKLGLDNDTLSKLRAWYGYKELIERLKSIEEFERLLKEGKVLTPDQLLSPDEYQRKLAEAEIIITTKGNFADNQSRAEIKSYDWEQEDKSFFLYDSTRKVNITVRALTYEGGRLIEPECCNPEYKTRKLLSVEDYEKLYIKEEEIR